MKRAAGAVLAAIGAFLLTAAVLVWVYARPQLVRAPLNQNTTTVAEADGATYLKVNPDTKKITIEHGAKLRATRVVHGDVKASSNDTVVYDVFLRLENEADNSLVKAYTDRVADDRRTALAVNCCGEKADDNPVAHHGLSYKFPFHTEKRTYELFDVQAKRPFPMQYKETTTLDGVEVYRFEQRISDEVIDHQDAPGELVGQPSVPTVNAELRYSNVRTVWVEPVTGSIVKGEEVQKQELAANGSRGTVLDADLVFTDKTVAERLSDARRDKVSASVISIMPAPLAALGLVLLLVGLVLIFAGRKPGAHRAVEPAEYQHT
ncbi:MAG: hypothetical protein QOJ50_4050 [Cryptosporangiaceae bacterium]|jgi:hypothetical protein|nr:hypothetical protein [Cryptosporangiaceae bacterium]